MGWRNEARAHRPARSLKTRGAQREMGGGGADTLDASLSCFLKLQTRL